VKRSLFLAFIVLFVVGHAFAGTVTAIRTSQVTKSLCIQVKTANLGGSGQPTLANIEADLVYLNPNGIGTGISCVRDASNGNTTSLNALGALGYKLDLYMGYNSAGTNVGSSIISALTGFNTSGYLAAVERVLASRQKAISMAPTREATSMARPIRMLPIRWIPFLSTRQGPAQRLHNRRVLRASMSWCLMPQEMIGVGLVPTLRQRRLVALRLMSKTSWRRSAMRGSQLTRFYQVR
jgi:hypothetical protein